METYITTLTLNAGATEIDFAVAIIDPLPPDQIELSAVLYNTILGTDYDFSSTLFPNINQIPSPPYTLNLPSTVTPFGSEYNDGVYRYYGGFSDGISEDYSSEAYLLNTTTIDDAIAAWAVTNGRQQATLDWANARLVLIQSEFDTPDYVEANRNILIARAIIVRPYQQVGNVPLTSAVVSSTEIELTIAPVSYGFLESYYCEVENTLTGDLEAFTWAFDPTNIADQTHTLVPLDLGYATSFLDGVYRTYVSGINWIDGGGYDISYNGGRLHFANSYLLVTESIDSQIEFFENSYNPNDPAQAALLVELNDAYALMLSLFNDEDYEGANAQIEAIQVLLEGVTVCNGLSASLVAGTTNQIVLSYPSLPVGVIAEQSGTIINSLTGEEYVFTGFPANDTNTQLILNSNDLGAGASFSDGVWQISNTFVVDATFQCTTYALVVTNARCCVRKAQARSATCKTLTGRAEELSSWLETAIDEFNYSAYSVSNGFIKKINAVCSGCGCGC